MLLTLDILTTASGAVISGSRARLQALARPWVGPPELAEVAFQVGLALPMDLPAAWITATGTLDLDRPVIVGIVNVTLKDQRQETMAAFEREILRCPEIVECFLMSGEADYMIQVEVRRDDSYERIHRETLARLPGVTRLASHFVIREVVRRS